MCKNEERRLFIHTDIRSFSIYMGIYNIVTPTYGGK